MLTVSHSLLSSQGSGLFLGVANLVVTQTFKLVVVFQPQHDVAGQSGSQQAR